MGELCKRAEPIKMLFQGLTHVAAMNHVLDEGPDNPWEEALLRGDKCRRIATYLHECTAPAMGECACPAHAADECIHRRKE